MTTGLYFGRSIVLPIILAVLLSFLLAPVVSSLRRLRVPRAPSVLLAVALALAGLGIAGAIIVSQAATLTKDAPAYAERISEKAAAVRDGVRQRFGSILQSNGGSGHQKARDARSAGTQAMNRPTDARVVPVEIRQPPASAMDEIRDYVLPALEPVETILIVLIVTIFILFQKEDLRDRLIRLMGTADIHRTTLALDDGAKRLSRYFLSQSIVNLGFGAAVWAGLFLIGVPSPGLWGAVAGLARFVPYVGVIVAMVGPLALASAVDPGWTMAIYVGLLFVLLEPIVGYLVEPLLYGHSTGLSPFAVVVAALFWTWIWGPVGLVLSMPVTLMLVVLGRHIPAFEVFDVLLGERPALSPPETFYQRILAGNIDGAIEHAEEQLESLPLVEFYDEVIVGGLRLAAAAFDRGAVDRASLRDVCETTLEVLAALEDYPDAASSVDLQNIDEPSSGEKRAMGCTVLCLSGRGPLDLAVERMAEQLLRRSGCEVEVQHRVSEIGDNGPDVQARHVDFLCTLGLFDERSFRRVRPVLASVAMRFPGSTLLIGVVRAGDQSLTGGSDDPLPSLRRLLRAINELGAASCHA